MKISKTTSYIMSWLVHIFTASGIALAFLALLATKNHDWRTAMFCLVLAMVIDGIDGFFARLFNVEDNLPFIKGKNIDYVVDFVNYAFVPAYMFYELALVPEQWCLALSLIIVVISALYYGRAQMVTSDNYFIGFPVLWNMVIFYYIFITDYNSIHYIWITLLISVLHFVPIKMAYPSQNNRLIIPSLIAFCILICTILGALYFYPIRPIGIAVCAYAVLIYFSGLTLYDTLIKK